MVTYKKGNVASAEKTAAAGKTAAAAVNREELMKRIQEVQFTMIDLMLYLDTHPCDSFAVERYNMAAEELHDLQMLYSEKFGPIMWGSINEGDTWLWAEEDFPWDY